MNEETDSPNKITETVKQRLEQIRKITDDPEQAHALEKALWRSVLEAAAAGDDVKQAAALALETEDVDFPRWFA